MNKKVSAIVVLVLLVLVGGYLASNKKANEFDKACGNVVTTARNPKTGEIITLLNSCDNIPDGWERVVDNSNWKTYTNSQYGIEFKYPSTWDVFEALPNIVVEDSQGGKLSPGKNVYFSFGVSAHTFPAIDEKPVIRVFGTRTGYVYTEGQSVYFPNTDGRVGAYVIQLEPRDHPEETNQILSTFKFTKYVK
jgi:hypothetical protein